ncbi:MAG: hypothetical protein LBF78_09795 [Treponema sp.]|jgi:hypothetical protein|nr:hypothetical protein [Treponema sp.]
MKSFLQKSLKKIGLYDIARRIYHSLHHVDVKTVNDRSELEQMIQVGIMNQYKIMIATPPQHIQKLPELIDTGFKVYSQFDEDGILLYIFSLIGFTNRKVVEICCGNGSECNAANLIINHACYGLLFDGDKFNIKNAITFFKNNKSTWLLPPLCKHAWITKDNIDSLIGEEGFNGDIDLLSLDIDGIDYYIWESLKVISPRVFICECHNAVPDDMAITIPYKDDFSCTAKDNYHEDFRSVSPLAMINLSKKKGYRLIGSHKYGFNLIFMRNDIGNKYFPEVELSEISNNQYTIISKETRWPFIKDAPWVEV